MKLSVGIVGLPNVGKSTLFKILTSQDVVIANYPFATVDPNVGVVPVPDERLGRIAELIKPEKVVPAVVEFFDIAGLVKGAHKGEGLGNQFLAKIREVDAVVHLVRVFESDDAVHIEGSVDPARDIETLHGELILKDLETVKKKLEQLKKDSKTGDKKALQVVELVEKVYSALADKKLASTLSSEVLGEDAVKGLFLLTAKPHLFVLNGKSGEVSQELVGKIEELGGDYVISDLSEVDSMDELIKKTYEILGLITFFTITGGKEVRAWAIRLGTTARDAAGVVHTDFEKNFIRAEVINWEKLIEVGGPSVDSTNSPQVGREQSNCWQEAKGRGLVRIEGKDYVVANGDVLAVKHGG